MTHYTRAAALGLFCLAVALPAAASHNTVQEVRISVIDPRTNQEVAVIAPEGSFELPQNEERVLRLFEPPRPERGERRYLPAEIGFGPVQTGLELTRRSAARGEAAVRVHPGGTTMPSGRLHVGYRIDDDVDLANEGLRLGRVFAEVVSVGVGGAPQRADDLVAALYRGILLRDPDPAAAARRDDIRRGGYAAALRQAREIAASRESEIEVYKRACNQQRLLALYKELLGRDTARIDQNLWRSQLDHLDRGDVEEVVSDLVESREFRDRWSLQGRGRRGG